MVNPFEDSATNGRIVTNYFLICLLLVCLLTCVPGLGKYLTYYLEFELLFWNILKFCFWATRKANIFIRIFEFSVKYFRLYLAEISIVCRRSEECLS